jgi:hypothetical protein
MKIRTSTAVSAAIIFLGLLLGYMHRQTFPMYAIIFLSIFLSGLLSAHSTKRASWLLHNVAFVFLALAITELFLEFIKNDEHAANLHVMQSQDGIGYVGRRGVFRAVKTYGFGTRLVYDVEYSMPNGWRVTPDSLKKNGPTVMFFGDSFTFGDGVNDDETLPNAFSILSGMRAANFGLSGWGPHQMLRLLELDIPKKTESGSPSLMVYTAIDDHISRAAGHVAWDPNGPLYAIQNGQARYVGSFSENNMTCRPLIVRSSVIEKLLLESRIWRAYIGFDADHCPAAPGDLLSDRTRFLEIVKAANLIAQRKYGCRLVVILWDVNYSDYAKQNMDWIESNLLQNDIPTTRLSSAIKNTDFKNWILRDYHPTPRAYREVAQTLLSWLKENPTLAPTITQ